MRHNFVPVVPRRVLARPLVLRAGDTPWSIAQAFGRGWSGYAELVGANLDLPLFDDKMPPGHAATLAGLTEGQELWLPASWAPRIHRAGGNATLRDVPDLLRGYVTGLLLQRIDLIQKAGHVLPFQEGHYERIINAATTWFRQSYPNTAPTDALLEPFLKSAIMWTTKWGLLIPQADADQLPWGEVPWLQVPWAKVPWTDVDWAAIRQWVQANMPLGAVQNQLFLTNWSQANWHGKSWANVPWAHVPWATVPWSLIPWQAIDWDAIWQAPNPADPSDTPTYRLTSALKAFAAGGANPADPTAPGECLPPRMMIHGQCSCPGPGLVWNPATKKCEPKGCAPGHHKDAQGKCVPDIDINTSDEPPPKKESFPWGTLLFVGAAAAVTAVVTNAVNNATKPSSRRASR